MAKIFIAFLQILPKNLISYWVGWLFRLKLPPKVALFVNRAFISITGIDLTDAEVALENYQNVEEVFVRKLKQGSRVIKGEIVSPCDGFLAVSRLCESGDLAFQAKGLYYSLNELLGLEGSDFRAGWYLTLYLAPHNYHRVHSPVSGEIKQIVYFPGKLWPVNRPLMRGLPNLYCENERLVFLIQTSEKKSVFVVMVGALNVGRINTRFSPDFFTNDNLSMLKDEHLSLPLKLPAYVKAGEELGVFMLGSTVIVIFESGFEKDLHFRVDADDTPIKMGESLIL